MKQKDLIARLIEQQGNTVAAAATLECTTKTLWNWSTGKRELKGPALVAVRAVLAHPEDYADFCGLARPAHRPRTTDPEG